MSVIGEKSPRLDASARKRGSLPNAAERCIRRRWAAAIMIAAALIGGSAGAQEQSKKTGGETHMLTEPKIERRMEQPYVGIRSNVTLPEIGTALPPLIRQVFAWLAERHATPAGPVFFRYRVIDMAGRLEVDVGCPCRFYARWRSTRNRRHNTRWAVCDRHSFGKSGATRRGQRDASAVGQRERTQVVDVGWRARHRLGFAFGDISYRPSNGA